MPLLAKLKKAFVPPDPKAALNAPPGVTRTKVWLDVSIANAEPGRIEIGEFPSIDVVGRRYVSETSPVRWEIGVIVGQGVLSRRKCIAV